MAKADRLVNFILPGPLLSLDTRSEPHDRGGTIRGKGGPSMAAIFGPGGPYICNERSGETDFEGGPSTAWQVYNKTTVDVKGFARKRRLWVNKERPTRTEVQATQKSRNLADNEEQLRSRQINYHLPGRYVTRAMMKTDGRKRTG